MPGLEGPQVLNALQRDGVKTSVIFLSAFMECELAYETVAAGARGYLSKESPREEICDAIAAVARGGTALRARGSGRPRGADSGSASAQTTRRS